LIWNQACYLILIDRHHVRFQNFVYPLHHFMNSRQLIKSIISRQGTNPRCGFWLGNPHPDTWPLLHAYFGTSSEEKLRHRLGDDFRWVTPQYMKTTYRHPDGRGIFDYWRYRKHHGEAGPLADCESPPDLESYQWPDPAYLNYNEALEVLENAGEVYRASGFWAPFFHDASDLMGMENFLTKMYSHPEVIHALLKKICSFYLTANELFYRRAGNLIDAYFFGNDFGTQRDLLLSPSQFEEFILPLLKKFINQALDFGYQVILHSCGSIYRIIDHLIDAGIDCLHPLQAQAAGMDAQSLAANFKGKIAFLGGLDTQHLLIHATPDEVKGEVRRLRKLLGPNLIISPSHEALLPNIPPKNVAAMAEAAHEI
jgi:uroporphyrinogen decarboxylase